MLSKFIARPFTIIQNIMKAIITTVLLIISFSAICQNPYHIADTTKKWSTLHFGFGGWNIAMCGGTRTIEVAEGFVYNDTTIYNVYETHDSLRQDWTQIGYLKEDTIAKKVYYSEWWPEEIGLLYDFNLVVGDTVTIDNYYVGFEDVLLICDSVVPILINGNSRNQFFFSTPYTNGISDIWIEGIGSKFGLLNSGFGGACYAGGSMNLLCCSKNDTIIYMDTVYNSCYIQDFYPKIVSECYDTAYLNEFYEFQVLVSDTNNIGSFALIGDVIPDDFDFDESTGLLTGMPSDTGSFPCIITIKNYDIDFLTDILYANITVALPTSINDIPKQPEINIHPNPFSASFSIFYHGNPQNSYYLEIFNSEGKMVYKETITDTDCTIDCSSYKKGIYLLKITDLNQQIVKVEKMIRK